MTTGPETVLLQERPAEAGELVAEGRRHMSLYDVDGYELAVVDLLRALEADPASGLGHAALAETYSFWGFRREVGGQESASYYALAHDHACSAMRFSMDRADSHRAMAVALRRGARRSDERRREEAELAAELDPEDGQNWAEVWRARGYGLDDEALARALELSPGLCGLQIDLGAALCEAGRLGEALAALRRALDINPRNGLALYDSAMVMDRMGRRPAALALLESARRLRPKDPLLAIGIGLLGGCHDAG